MTATEIRAKIESEVPGARAEVRDYTGTGDHFQVRVVAPSFEGRTLVERRRGRTHDSRADTRDPDPGPSRIARLTGENNRKEEPWKPT